jgi:hypothetical protein
MRYRPGFETGGSRGDSNQQSAPRRRRRHRLVLSTDVVEHVPSPVEHLQGACARVAEGGALYVQTPDAHHIDLARAGSARQVLQQPYHRHLVTATWLVGQLRRLGFELVAQTHRPYFHTRIPFLRPGFWYRGLTGGFVSRTDEVQLVFRRPGPPPHLTETP